MNSAKIKPAVLIVDDQYRSLQTLPRLIASEMFAATWVPDEHQGLALLKQHPAKDWIVIVDLKSSGMGGGGFLQQARQIAPQVAILVTGPLGPFLYKDGSFYEFSGPTLKQEINKVLQGILQKLGTNGKNQTADEVPEPALEKQRFGSIIGRSRNINDIYRLIQNLRDSLATVLIQGESGTGKELIARTIHLTSQRKKRLFVAINCGAIPYSLIESELFGHERGAFTGAVCQKKGKFEIAHGGTLFLDEIGELDKDLQVKLLRVLQEKEFQRVGGNATHTTDVRVIAATSLDLKKSLHTGEFRDDLYYRLNVVPIYAPPLRERKEDIPLLLDHFFQKIAASMSCALPLLTEEARQALKHYSYRGNVRELANIVERLLVTCPNGRVAFPDLPAEVRAEAGDEYNSSEWLNEIPNEGVSLKEVERELIVKTLQKCSGNKQAAARMLGITRRLLYLRLAQFGIQ